MWPSRTLEVVGKARVGSNRRLVREAHFDALKTNWHLLLILAVLIAGLCIGEYALPGPPPWHAFVLGVLFTGGVVGEVTLVHIASGTHQRSLGVFGESATAEAACGRWHRLRGWRHVGGLYFHGHGDVDHTLIGPRGVYAIETKWTSEQWSIVDGRLVGPYTENVLAQATASAERIRLALNYRRDKLNVNVCPVVFLWGPGSPAIAGGFVDIDGVRVVEGRWARLRHHQVFDGAPMSRKTRRNATQLLQDLSKSQQPPRP